MSSNELNTLRNFINSNNSFCNALRNEAPLYLDSTIKIELIIYYLTLNKPYIKQSLGTEADIFTSLIESQDFILTGDTLVFNGLTFNLEYLINIVHKIEESKQLSYSKKIIYLKPNKEPKAPKPLKKAQVIQISEVRRGAFYTALEKGLVFERTLRVNDDTINYINSTREDFKELMNTIIVKSLSSNLDEYDRKYLKVLSSYLNLYPFTTYLRGKKTVPYSELSLKQNEIGLRKTTHNNSFISELERKIELLIKREAFLERQIENYEADISVSNRILTTTEQELLSIKKEKLAYFVELYNLQHTPEIYNENLLSYLASCYEAGYVEINRFFQNPIIKLFYVDNERVEFHCSLRLDTLINLFDSSHLLSILEDQKKLKIES